MVINHNICAIFCSSLIANSQIIQPYACTCFQTQVILWLMFSIPSFTSWNRLQKDVRTAASPEQWQGLAMALLGLIYKVTPLQLWFNSMYPRCGYVKWSVHCAAHMLLRYYVITIIIMIIIECPFSVQNSQQWHCINLTCSFREQISD